MTSDASDDQVQPPTEGGEGEVTFIDQQVDFADSGEADIAFNPATMAAIRRLEGVVAPYLTPIILPPVR